MEIIESIPAVRVKQSIHFSVHTRRGKRERECGKERERMEEKQRERKREGVSWRKKRRVLP